MKVLVISLLRLGDFIQVLPAISGLRRQFGVAQVDVLTHPAAQALKPMFQDVTQWWTMDRDLIQKGLSDAEVPFLTSFDLLKETLDEIQAQNYDLIVNLTQTAFSGWIAGYLNGPRRLGLAYDQKGIPRFHSPWFTYLDEHAPLDVKDIFHYTDIFYFGSGLTGGDRAWKLNTTEKGRRELESLKPNSHERIVLQVFTSEEKKNWAASAWMTAIDELHRRRPGAEFYLLGAPFEEERLKEIETDGQARGLPVRRAILSLEGALSLLTESGLLITGDTSIKHLANAVSTPVLELSLGSSDWRRTGAYKSGSVILQPRMACAPCPHSGGCTRPSHDCAEKLSASDVATAAEYMLRNDQSGLQNMARERNAVLQILQTRITNKGYWMAMDLTATPDQVLGTLLDRSITKFMLDGEHRQALVRFGSESLILRRDLEDIFPGQSWNALDSQLDFIENSSGKASTEASSLLKTMNQWLSRPAAEMDECLVRIRRFFAEHRPYARSLFDLEELKNMRRQSALIPIAGLRRVHSEIDEVHRQSEVKAKLARLLKTQLMESL